MKERNEVVLVDMRDREIGIAEKQQAHMDGLLHRAFSVFLYRGDEILLQKRAPHKYHCGGLWTNTCCSHPGKDETVLEAARERLLQETGIHAEGLEEIGSFIYRAVFENGLTEYEYDHVIIGEYDGSFDLNRDEVEEISWVRLNDLMADLLISPQKYTPWFLTALKPVVDYIEERHM